MDSRPSATGSADQGVLLIRPGELPDAAQRALHAAAARVTRLVHPSDAEIREALSERVDSVIVCSRDDAVALRLELVVEYVRPGVVHSGTATAAGGGRCGPLRSRPGRVHPASPAHPHQR
jgi:hypothetical protein